MKITMYAVFDRGDILKHTIRPTETMCMAHFLQHAQMCHDNKTLYFDKYPHNWVNLKEMGYTYHAIHVTIDSTSK